MSIEKIWLLCSALVLCCTVTLEAVGNGVGCGNLRLGAIENTDNLPRKCLLDILLNDTVYDSKTAPDFDKDTPTTVTIQIFIVTIDSINEVTMDYSIEVFLRQTWYDDRLNYSNLSNLNVLELDPKIITSVWVPDTIFYNEKKASMHTVTVPNTMMHLYRNGTVHYSLRLSLLLTCFMHLHKYPLDRQTCPIIIESYGYTRENVVFKWNEHDGISLSDTARTVQQFQLDRHNIQNCSNPYGNFTCIRADLYFERNTGYYITQIYIPTILTVVLSWVSFWIDVGATPARVSLGVLTILTMTTQTSGAVSSLPKVSYTKALDIWNAACLIFVFASFIEYAYVNVLTRKGETRYPKCLKLMMNSHNCQCFVPETEVPDHMQIRFGTCAARSIDKIARFAFPTCFILFNVLYWTIFTTMEFD